MSKNIHNDKFKDQRLSIKEKAMLMAFYFYTRAILRKIRKADKYGDLVGILKKAETFLDTLDDVDDMDIKEVQKATKEF